MNTHPRLEAISTLRNDIVAISRRLRQSAGTDGETWTALMVLGAIERAEGLATPTQITAELELRSSNLAQILGDLGRRGLIERTPDAADKRRALLSLTTEGLDLVRETRSQRTRWLAEALGSSLSAAEQDQLMGMMRRLALSTQASPLGR